MANDTTITGDRTLAAKLREPDTVQADQEFARKLREVAHQETIDAIYHKERVQRLQAHLAARASK